MINKIIFAVYTVLIALISLRPMNGVAIEHWDKLGHLVIYAIFAVLAHRVTRNALIYMYLCVAIIIYGGLMEFGQSFFPGRLMSIADFLANTVGVGLGAWMMTRFFARQSPPQSTP
jgi:VanZ family protein